MLRNSENRKEEMKDIVIRSFVLMSTVETTERGNEAPGEESAISVAETLQIRTTTVQWLIDTLIT